MIITILICFFAAFGVFQILYTFACYMTKGKGEVDRLVHRIVPVTDETIDLEGYIRYLALKDNMENVILLNMTENIDTIKMMRILTSEYDFVYIMSVEEYLEYVNDEFK